MRKDWEIKKLGEVCEFGNGQAHEKFVDDEGEFILVNSKFISSEGEVVKRTNKQLSPLFKNDIVFVMSDVPNGKALAKCFLIDKDNSYTLNQRICVIRSGNYETKYLLYHLNRHEYLLSFNNGENQTNLRKNDILNCPLVTPPIPEQKRIVSILDQAFAAINKAKANAEQNLLNAKELFESVLNSLIIDDGKLKMEKLGDVCEIKGRIGYRGYTVQDLVQKGEGAITLSPSNIQDNKFITDKCTYISWFKYEESPEIMVFEGDILFVKTGSTYGKVALVENLPEKATINPQFVVLKDIKCSNRFLYFALTTKAFKEKVENIVGGAATPTLSQTNLAEQTIPLPPLKEQLTIVRQLDALRAETKKLEAVYQKKIVDLEELKKSILQKAFAGEL
ncbi:MAG: restriction endonuclease subunit S [Salinivirgaceae bacterium]